MISHEKHYPVSSLHSAGLITNEATGNNGRSREKQTKAKKRVEVGCLVKEDCMKR
jgi:hypothetical protein